MHLSLSSACLYLFPLRYLFRLAAETGYDGIELVMAPEVWLRGPAYVRALSREFGLPVYSDHQAMLPICPRGSGTARMGDATEAALALDCPVVVIHDPLVPRWDAPTAQRWMRELEYCQHKVEGSGTRLALENPGWYHSWDERNLFAQPLALISFARRYGLELTFDTCHAGSAEMGLGEVYETLRDRVVNVHFSDLKPGNPPLNINTLRTLLIHHQMPGEGRLPLTPFVAQLAKDGYDGPLTLEISVAALRIWSPRALRRRLAQAADYARETMRCAQLLDRVAMPT